MTAPQQRRKTSKPTSAAEWKKKNEIAPTELPSGCYMKLKRVGLQTLMSLGVMPNSLMGIAQKAVGKGEGKNPQAMTDEEMLALVNNPQQVRDIVIFMDKMVCLVAQEPRVYPAPKEGVERDDDLLYTDEIADEDKMFIFQVVTGGTTDLEEFRNETGATLASIRGREDVELPS